MASEQRRVAVLKDGPLPTSALLYRTEHSAWDPRQRVFHYGYPVELHGHDHPLRLLFEHLLVGLAPPSLMMLRSVVQVDAAVAAFIYLYPDRVNHPSLGAFVDFVCRFERWGSTGAFPSAHPSQLYAIRAIRDILPSPGDAAALSDQACTDILMDAVSALDQAYGGTLPVRRLPGVSDVLFETDRIVAVRVEASAELDVWDGIFAAGKCVSLVVRPPAEAAIMRRSLLVTDLDFDALLGRLNQIEPGWRMETALAIVGPSGGTKLSPVDLASVLADSLIC